MTNMEFPTSLGTSTADEIRLLGQDLTADLMGKVGFGELAFWLVAMRRPTREEVRVFEAVNAADVRMVERREDLGFPFEPGEAVRVLSKRLGQDFQRDVAIQLRVAGAVDLAHAAAAEERQDLIRAEPRARGKGQMQSRGTLYALAHNRAETATFRSTRQNNP